MSTEFNFKVSEGTASRTGALSVRNFSNFDNISGLPGREVILSSSLVVVVFTITIIIIRWSPTMFTTSGCNSQNWGGFLGGICFFAEGNFLIHITESFERIRNKYKAALRFEITLILAIFVYHLRFFEAVCMKSAFMVQRPEKLFIHSDTGPPTGRSKNDDDGI